MPTRPSLHVWLYGKHLGMLSSPSFQKLRFTPDPGVVHRWPLGSTVLSLSLPFNGRVPNGVPVRAFFEGLLPEGEARTALEREFGVPRGDSFGLLVELGRDCAGAVVLTPDDERPDEGSGGVRLLDDEELASAVDHLAERPLGASPDARVSLAGQQSKLLLTRDDSGRFGRAVGGAATNVLLKPEPTNFPGYAMNEAFCMLLARNVGLTTVTVEVLQVSDRAVLVVPRYDRAERRDARVLRLHQEDTCQALGLDCSDRDRKYERDGGPTLAKVAALLDRHGVPGDRRRLLAYTAFSVAVGNADAHGKNLSVLHHANGQAELAPMYDVSSTVQYESVETPTGRRRLSTEMGMTVNRVRDVHHVTQNDLLAEAVSWGLSRDDADRTVRRTLEGALAQLDRTRDALPSADAKLVDDVHDRCRALLAGMRVDGLTPQNVTDPTTRQQLRRELRERNGVPTLER